MWKYALYNFQSFICAIFPFYESFKKPSPLDSNNELVHACLKNENIYL